jgi:hypothetical protein
MMKDLKSQYFGYNFDGIVKNSIYCVIAFFCSFGILGYRLAYLKITTPCSLNFSIWNFYDAV